MNHTSTLPLAEGLVSTPDPLQVMWEDRWMLLAAHGKADWLKRHGKHLLDAPRNAAHPLLRALRRMREDWTNLPFQRMSTTLCHVLRPVRHLG
jgi:hypothetical protein